RLILVELKLQAPLAGGVGQRLHATVESIPIAVELHLVDAERERLLSDLSADDRRGGAVPGVSGEPDVGAQGRHRDERATELIVDDLTRDVLAAAEHRQPGTLSRTVDRIANRPPAPQPSLLFQFLVFRRTHRKSLSRNVLALGRTSAAAKERRARGEISRPSRTPCPPCGRPPRRDSGFPSPCTAPGAARDEPGRRTRRRAADRRLESRSPSDSASRSGARPGCRTPQGD